MVFILLATFTGFPPITFSCLLCSSIDLLCPLTLSFCFFPFLFSFLLFIDTESHYVASACRVLGFWAFATVFNFAVLLITSRSATAIPALLSILVTWVFLLFPFRNNLFLGLVMCMCLCLWVGVCARELQVPKDAGSPVAMVVSSYDLVKVSARTRTPNLCRNSECSQLLGHPSSPCFLLLVLLITITKFIDFF